MKKILLAAGVIGLIGVVVAVSLRRASGGRGVRVYMEDVAVQPRLLATVAASGEIRPRVEVNISSQVPGQIVDLAVEEGDRVAAGQVLVQLDPERHRSEVLRLEAQLRMFSVNMEKERVSLKNAEVTLGRQEALHAQKIVSDEALDLARLAVDAGRITLRSLEEQVRQAEADLVRARDDLAKTTLRAPIGALVSRVNAKVGEQVIIGTMNNPGTVILTLSDMTEVLAEVRVDETDVTQVKPGQRAEVRVDAVEGHAYEGRVESIGNAAVREGTVSRFPVKILLAAPDARLRPGMSAHAAVEVDERRDVLAVPLQALVRRSLKDFLARPEDLAKRPSGVEAAAEPGAGGAPTAGEGLEAGKDPKREQVQVALVDRGGRAEMVKVRTGISDAFRVEILEGLREGDRLILGPYRRLRSLKNGDPVRRVEKEEIREADEGSRD
jgi:HlyD family secretion protein